MRVRCWLAAILVAGAIALPHQSRLEYIKELNAASIHWTAGLSPRFAEHAVPTASLGTLCGTATNFSQVVQQMVQQGSLELVTRQLADPLPQSFDSAKQWPQCAGVIEDIR